MYSKAPQKLSQAKSQKDLQNKHVTYNDNVNSFTSTKQVQKNKYCRKEKSTLTFTNQRAFKALISTPLPGERIIYVL